MTRFAAHLDSAKDLLRPGNAVAGLGGDAVAFVLGRVAAEGRWLVVVDDDDRAGALLRGLRFFHPNPERVELFPGDDNRAYDGFSPDPSIPQQRLKVLEKLDRGGDLVVVAPVRALLQRIVDRETRRRGTRTLEVGAKVDRDALSAFLSHAGYLHTSRADAPGRYSVRGDLLDVWPTGNKAPVRVDWFDDEIESLRRLSPDTLVPEKSGKRVTILPAVEERLDRTALDRALVELGRLVALRGEGTARRRQVVEELEAGVRFSGLQDWLPALVPTMAPLEAFATLEPVVIYPDDVEAQARDFEHTVRRRYEQLEEDERPLVPPEERYVPAADVIAGLTGAREVLELPSGRAPDLGATGTEELAVRGAELAPVVKRLEALAAADVRVGLVVDDSGRGERLLELFEPHGLRPERVSSPHRLEAGKISLLEGDLPRGFVAAESGWAFVPVGALFGARKAASERAHTLWEQGVTSTAQLKVGDAVVHRLHGVGLYQGLVRLEVSRNVEQDFVRLEYRGGDLMFLPVASLEQLSRYTATSTGATPTLDKLGGQSWARRKGRVRDTLLALAQDLLRLYARRELAVREPFPHPGRRYRTFEARFPYRETPDQQTTIDAVMDDLSRPYPMDRLVCGDVGFGKTEIAMRAAMRVVEAGKQVLVLCPTTVLAHQHVRSFRQRFSVDPEVRVGMLSRFTTPAEEKELLAGIDDGTLQIVVGTTALLSPRVRFKDLGLAIVDEEHRFGVKQKERLKRMRTEIDVLALSATPIPRTMHMALAGVREMSIVATPPPDRLAVRTVVARHSEARVRDAIVSELERGGQVYFVHNRVETIDKTAEELRRWVPDVRIAVAHGQMADEELERVLVEFVERRYDVLVCSAIVESGVDLPNVNTMIVNRADRFGLSQLYQLRGRVGRGDRRATCILLTPEETTAEARKRLRVIVENQTLGSGFQVAAADLELRGGGNLIGSAQSGNIDEIGYETWVELLGEAVSAARGDLERERIDPEIELPVPAFIPDDLVKDTNDRMTWYNRIGHAGSEAEIDRRLDELEGEVGDLPEQVRNLGDLVAVRLACREFGIVRCAWHKVRLTLELHASSPLHGKRLEQVVAQHPKRFEVKGDKLSIRFTPAEGDKPFRYLRWVFSQLRREAA